MMGTNRMAASIWTRIDSHCAINHRWDGDEVSFTFQESESGPIGLELDVTDEGFDKLVAAVERARAARDTEPLAQEPA